jgi:2-polyprenyl-3-methyl-5-hydroxy-6-metoxy-1,4-benzoquinol methylase
MENVLTRAFLRSVLVEIRRTDHLHFKHIKQGLHPILKQSGMAADFNDLHNVICHYFQCNHITPQQVAIDYLHMVGDMRREMGYFMINNKYSCPNQSEALKRVYSQPLVMRYYLNALLVSNLLWEHHFRMLMYFKTEISALFKDSINVLDIGSGYGLYAKLVKECWPGAGINIIDISETSLRMAQQIVGADHADFINCDIFDYYTDNGFDLIILGEILEHLDDPLELLKRVAGFLSPNGVLWLTVPTNAPAIDHVYLFRDKQQVIEMISAAGLHIVESITLPADQTTDIIGLFCTLNEI